MAVTAVTIAYILGGRAGAAIAGAVIAAYVLGSWTGIANGKRQALVPGVWVEITKPMVPPATE